MRQLRQKCLGQCVIASKRRKIRPRARHFARDKSFYRQQTSVLAAVSALTQVQIKLHFTLFQALLYVHTIQRTYVRASL